MATEKQRRTFISYSRVDKDFALKLAKELRSSGFNIWLDQLDIPTGARWDDELERALDECEIFMVIITPASSASDNVKDEIGYAIDHGKRILPVLLEDADVPFRLRRFQYVDFTSKSYEEGIESAKKLLTRLIDESTISSGEVPVISQDEEARAKEERVVKTKAERLAKQGAEADRKIVDTNVYGLTLEGIKFRTVIETWLQIWWARGLIAAIIGVLLAMIALAIDGYYIIASGDILAITFLFWGIFGVVYYSHKISHVLTGVLSIIGYIIFLFLGETLGDVLYLGTSSGFILSAIVSRTLQLMKKI